MDPHQSGQSPQHRRAGHISLAFVTGIIMVPIVVAAGLYLDRSDHSGLRSTASSERAGAETMSLRGSPDGDTVKAR